MIKLFFCSHSHSHSHSHSYSHSVLILNCDLCDSYDGCDEFVVRWNFFPWIISPFSFSFCLTPFPSPAMAWVFEKTYLAGEGGMIKNWELRITQKTIRRSHCHSHSASYSVPIVILILFTCIIWYPLKGKQKLIFL